MKQKELDLLRSYLYIKKSNGARFANIDIDDIVDFMRINCDEEPIDDNELDAMADDYHKTCYHVHSDDIVLTYRIQKAFKAGYRKAKQE